MLSSIKQHMNYSTVTSPLELEQSVAENGARLSNCNKLFCLVVTNDENNMDDA